MTVASLNELGRTIARWPFDVAPQDYLTHYTKTVDAIVNILQWGFGWSQLPRGVSGLLPADLVLPAPWEEPEQFGMVSFTEAKAPASSTHRRDFGGLGIVVRRAWVASLGGRPVEYVEQGSERFEELQRMADSSIREMRSHPTYPELGFGTLGEISAAIASGNLGGQAWARFLRTFAFIGPAKNAWQREWRIAKTVMEGGIPHDRAERLANISPPRGWGQFLHVQKVPAEDVLGFVAPALKAHELRASLSEEFRGRPVVYHFGTYAVRR